MRHQMRLWTALLMAVTVLVAPGGAFASEGQSLPGAYNMVLVGGSGVLPPQQLVELRATTTGDTLRIGGSSRFGTAAAVSAQQYPSGSENVVITTGSDFADALAAVPVASSLDAPLLLTQSDGLPQETRAELQRLAPQSALVVGAESAIGEWIRRELRMLGIRTVTRIGGIDRYDTAALLSESHFDRGVESVFVVSGLEFAAGVSAGAAAASSSEPILISHRDFVPDALRRELLRLRPKRVFVVGDASIVSSRVVSEIQFMLGVPVARLSGPDSHATAAAVSARVFKNGATMVKIATNLDFVDALLAGGFGRGPVLFSSEAGIPDATLAELDRLGEFQRPILSIAPQTVNPDSASPLTMFIADSDSSPSDLELRIVDQPRHGSLEVVGLEVGYTSDPGYLGPDRLSLSIADGLFTSRPVAVDITVRRAGPPNIVMIMADDLGYGDLGSYGQQYIKTPRLDAMAANGARFTEFYSGSPWCPPARSTLMTGQHGGRSFLRHVGWFPEGQQTIAKSLRDDGYSTALFGKWGLGQLSGQGLVGGSPIDAGFEEFTGYLSHRDAHAYYLDSPETPAESTPAHPYYSNLRQFLYTSSGTDVRPMMISPDRYTHDEFIDRSLDFIEEQRLEPFFLYLPVTIPHAELVVPPDEPGENLLGQYLNEDGTSIFPEIPYQPELDGLGYDRWNDKPRATYAAMVSRLDRDVGRIQDLIIELGLAEDTLIVFTSDNGPHDEGGIERLAGDFSFDSAGGLAGGKYHLTEGGIRVPALAWWPGTIAPGTVIDKQAALWDLAPTFAEMA
ncbi:MAG: sulfatase-like hydrolase/transferase, partial [Acidimicrobiia bacterium]|nr:sulfatase-like hydrolase/transferase [Acidimicrobiia bacterium]